MKPPHVRPLLKDGKTPEIIDPADLIRADASAGRGLTEFEQEIIRKETDLRTKVADRLTYIFIGINAAIIIMIILFSGVDSLLIYADKIKSGDRVVTQSAIMSLIGATTVQLGAVVYMMAAWLFKKEKQPERGQIR